MNVNDNDEQIRFASGLNIFFALWEIASPFTLGYWWQSHIAAANAILVGVIALVMAWTRTVNPYAPAWRSVVSVVLGAWLIIAPFFLNTAMYASAYWNDLAIGICLIVFAGWSALAARGLARPPASHAIYLNIPDNK